MLHKRHFVLCLTFWVQFTSLRSPTSKLLSSYAAQNKKNVLKVNFPRFFLYLCIFFRTFALAFGKRVAKNGAHAIGDRYLRSIFELTKLSDGKENKKKQLVNL